MTYVGHPHKHLMQKQEDPSIVFIPQVMTVPKTYWTDFNLLEVISLESYVRGNVFSIKYMHLKL